MKISYLRNLSLLLSLSSMAVEIEIGHNQKKYQLVAKDTETLKDLRFKSLTSWVSPLSRESKDQHGLSSNELVSQCGEPLQNYIERYTKFWGNSASNKEEILKELSSNNKYSGLLKIDINPFPKNDFNFQTSLESTLNEKNLSHLLPYFKNLKTITVETVKIHFLDSSASKVFRKETLLKNLEEVFVGQTYSTHTGPLSITIKALDLWCDLYQRKIQIELGLLIQEEDYQHIFMKLKNSELNDLKNFLEKVSIPSIETKPEDQELSYLIAGQKMAQLMEIVPALEKSPQGQDALFPLSEILLSREPTQTKINKVEQLFTQRWSQEAKYRSKTTLGPLDLGLEQTSNQGSATNEKNK